MCFVCVAGVVHVCFAYHSCIRFSTFLMNLLCACVFFGIVFSLFFCEPVVCVSAFLVCVLTVRFVYGLRVVFVCFHCVFMNMLLCLVRRWSCVVCVCVAQGLRAIFVYS